MNSPIYLKILYLMTTFDGQAIKIKFQSKGDDYMKNLSKKIALTLTLIMSIVSIPAFASTTNENDNAITPRYLEQYNTYWKITSSSYSHSYFGEWRTGPTGRGPGTLNINESTNLNRNFTANISSGKVQVGNSTIGAQLGVSIGKSISYGTSYSITLGNNERKTIIYRPKVAVHKVTQTKYRTNNYTGKTEKLATETVTVDTFSSWDYDWRNGY